MIRPRIGITTDKSYDIGEYERAVTAAGGEPVRLLPSAERSLDGLDGIVFSGGDDIDPARYGAIAHPQTQLADPQRDAYELALMRAAFEGGMPTLAICRGLQVANVALGGALHQHVPDAYGTAVPHNPQVDGTTFRGLIDAHCVAIVPGSRLAAIAGAAVVTGSRHHQSVDRVAEPLRVVGRAPDGVVEALEAPEARSFWLAVQWHPESTVDLDGGASAALFAALVAAAQG